MGNTSDAVALRTPLYDLHRAHGGKMVTFAGYELPIQYQTGVLAEHLHTRKAAGLFDVSHMGQVEIRAKSGDLAHATAALERLVPADVQSLGFHRQRYALFTNDAGGILDDLMIANLGDRLFLVVNAACKATDIEHLRAHLSDSCTIEVKSDRALLALQGPSAVAVMAACAPEAVSMAFMDCRDMMVAGRLCTVSRSGYTGEDGYEIGMASSDAVAVAEALLEQKDVAWIGLGARDSLRLEAGLCLYGADLDITTTPIEAGLSWSIQKSRRPGGARAGGYPGADLIGQQLETGASRRRVGLLPEGKVPVRAGAILYASPDDAEPIGTVTSGGFGPSVEGPVAMGYLNVQHAEIGTIVHAEVRGRRLPVAVAAMPFIQKTYKR